jgi:hypothetical protein
VKKLLSSTSRCKARQAALALAACSRCREAAPGEFALGPGCRARRRNPTSPSRGIRTAAISSSPPPLPACEWSLCCSCRREPFALLPCEVSNSRILLVPPCDSQIIVRRRGVCEPARSARAAMHCVVDMEGKMSFCLYNCWSQCKRVEISFDGSCDTPFFFLNDASASSELVATAPKSGENTNRPATYL